MKQFSPNLKPKSDQHHIDRANKLGVPRSNVVDLRKLAQFADDSSPLQSANINTTNHNNTSKTESTTGQVDTSSTPIAAPKTSWRERRRIAKQAKSLAKQTAISIAKTNAPQAAPIPQTAQLKPAAAERNTTPINETSDVGEISEVLQKLSTPTVQPPKPARPRTAKTTTSKKRRSQRYIPWVQAMRPMVAFVAICAVLILPFATLAMYQRVSSVKSEVIATSQEAVDNLSAGSEQALNLDFEDAQDSFGEASAHFQTANDQLQSVNASLEPIIKIIPKAGDQYTSAENVLVAGEQISAAAEDITKAFTLLSDIQSFQVFADDSNTDFKITDVLVAAHSQMSPAVLRLQRAEIALQDVDVQYFPEEYQADLQFVKDTVPVVSRSLQQLKQLNETLLIVLGHEDEKRYLVLNANTTERRGCMGFLGSASLIDVRQGQIRKMVSPGGGLYDLAGGENFNTVAPYPFTYVNGNLHAWDANMYPDCPTSSLLVQKLLRNSGWPSVDGVIYLSPDIITELLKVTGPISMSEYAGSYTEDNSTSEETNETSTDTDIDTESDEDDEDIDDTEGDAVDQVGEFELDDEYLITAENFYEVTQRQAERKYDDTNASKQFISDFTPKLLDKVFSSDVKDLVPILEVLYTALSEKNMVINFNDPFLRNEIQQLGWTGDIKSTNKDYLQVVHQNIAGGKIDQVLDETIEHHADIQSDGKIIDTVTVTLVHNGSSDNDLQNVGYQAYLQFYTPLGSSFISADGFTQPDANLQLQPEEDAVEDEDIERITGNVLIDDASQTRINDSFNKTIFSNWVQIAPGETSRVTIQYELPFTISMQPVFHPADSYSLLVQKQPGAYDPLFINSVSYPDNYNVRWAYPESGSLHQPLKQDAYTGLVFEL